MAQRRTDILDGGPHDYWAEDKPVSRGQWRHIALAALRVLGMRLPRNRMEATHLMVRLRLLAGEVDDADR